MNTRDFYRFTGAIEYVYYSCFALLIIERTFLKDYFFNPMTLLKFYVIMIFCSIFFLSGFLVPFLKLKAGDYLTDKKKNRLKFRAVIFFILFIGNIGLFIYGLSGIN